MWNPKMCLPEYLCEYNTENSVFTNSIVSHHMKANLSTCCIAECIRDWTEGSIKMYVDNHQQTVPQLQYND